MKPIRISVLAAATAAMLALPISSADAHRRHFGHHHGGNAAGAIALGIISGAIIGSALAPRHHYRAPPGYCYDYNGRPYYCDHVVRYGDPYYRPAPRVRYYGPQNQFYRHHQRIYDGHIHGGHKYYEIQRNERR